MKIIYRKIAELSKKEFTQIKSFLINCFSEYPDYKNIVYTNIDLDYCILLYQGNSLIAHASIIKRKINYKGNNYIVGGVGNIAVSKLFRKKGYGSDLLKAVNESLKQKEFDFGLLFCLPKLHNFYTRSGWIKKEKGKTIYYYKDGEKYVEENCYYYPLKVLSIDMSDLINDDIYIGEGIW